MAGDAWKNQKREGGRFGGLKTNMRINEKINDMQKKIKYPLSKTTNPWKKQKKEMDDFASYFLPTDDIYASSGSGTDGSVQFAFFEWLAEHRIGVGQKITRKPAEDAIRGRFTIRDYDDKEVIDKELFDWMEIPDIDFWNTWVQALYYERVYGIAFIMRYYTESDHDDGDFSKPAPKGKRPIGLQAFPPTVMGPVNIHKTYWLDSNPQKWNLQGGIYNSREIHYSRVHVLMTRRSATRWNGLSVFEPIWIPLMAYFQAMIYLLRGFAELGTVIPVWLIDQADSDDLDELWTIYANVLDEMKMNGKFVGKKGDEFAFQTTNLAAGLNDLIEIWKEDISAGTNIPVNLIFGRITASGLGQGGYQTQERYYMNELGNIESQISDDIIRFINESGFPKITNKVWLDWNLTPTKTDEQRLMDEALEIENEIRKEQLMQTRLQTDFMTQNVKEGKPPQGEEEPKNQENNNKSDFIFDEIRKKRMERIEKMRGERKFQNP